jgi:hypothetical protein
MLRPQRPPRSGGDLDIYRTLDVCHSMSLVTIAIMFISVVVSWRLLLHTGTPYREEAHTICSTHTLAGFLIDVFTFREPPRPLPFLTTERPFQVSSFCQ